MIKHNLQYHSQLNGWWCIVHQHRVFMSAPSQVIPYGLFEELNLPVAQPQVVHEIGEYEQQPVYMMVAAEIEDEQHFVGLRSVLYHQTPIFELVARAYQVSLFLKTHQYCGQCGQPMELIDWELATKCDDCNHRCYPRISPCIIVAIRKGKSILLAKGKRSTNGLYSTLAGFVESGETLEQAVHREVFEEVGIRIKNVKYVSSQPWPFPHSLMAGFVAEYESGEINICDHEIEDANWYQLDNMPETPSKLSISGQLIDKTKKMMALL